MDRQTEVISNFPFRSVMTGDKTHNVELNRLSEISVMVVSIKTTSSHNFFICTPASPLNFSPAPVAISSFFHTTPHCPWIMWAIALREYQRFQGRLWWRRLRETATNCCNATVGCQKRSPSLRTAADMRAHSDAQDLRLTAHLQKLSLLPEAIQDYFTISQHHLHLLTNSVWWKYIYFQCCCKI